MAKNTLLQLTNIEKAYHKRSLFSLLTVTVSEKQHIAVIGRNGAGKSTLLRMIMDIEHPDSGTIQIHDGTRIGYIRQQEPLFNDTETVIAFLMRSSGKPEWECAKMAGTFDIKHDQLTTVVALLSGGYQMRVTLIAILLDDPNLLLLDEPTNYLDLATLLLLERFLQTYNGSFLLISHDREFLERTCTHTLEVSQGNATLYSGTVSEYLVHKAQQEEATRRYNKKVAREQRHLQAFVDRFRYKASKASQAQSKLKQLNKLEQIAIDPREKDVVMILPEIEQKVGWILSAEELSIGYEKKVVADDISFDIVRGEHVGIVGNNGQGKTTLLKTLAGTIPSLSGKIDIARNTSVGVYAQHVADVLDPKQQVLPYLAAQAGADVSDQDLYRMAGNFLFSGDDLEKPISVLSGGEKARLCLAGLLLQKHDLLLLDEPTNHLDVETVEALSQALAASQATILFVSHNRTFVSTIADSIIEVKNGSVRRSAHNYENYVYHLKEELKIAEPEQVSSQDEKKAQRISLRAELKEKKKAIKQVEHDTMELEKKKQVLMSWFEKNHSVYNRAKQDELSILNTDLHEAEELWLQLQQHIDELEKQIATLQ